MAFEFKCKYCSQKIRIGPQPESDAIEIDCPGCERSFMVRLPGPKPKEPESTFDALGAFAKLDAIELAKLDAEVASEPEIELLGEPTPEASNPIQQVARWFYSVPRRRRIEIGVITIIVVALAVMVGGFLASGGPR